MPMIKITNEEEPDLAFLKKADNWLKTEGLVDIQVLGSSKANTLLANSKRNVWWKEEKDGWKVKAAQSGKFLYIA